MKTKLVFAALLATVAGCGSIPSKPQPTVAISRAIHEKEVAIFHGQTQRAVEILRYASESFPGEKLLFLEMARLQFSLGDYGQTILNGLEVLKIDPNDTIATSLVAVAGLRISHKALIELRSKSGTGQNGRANAQELTNLLRWNVGQKILVPRK